MPIEHCTLLHFTLYTSIHLTDNMHDYLKFVRILGAIPDWGCMGPQYNGE